jgi:putative peptide zinc metalloprotease protein
MPDRGHAAAPRPLADRPPRLADGVELIGEFAGSGYKEPPYIARRADGQVVYMGKLFFLVAEEIDGHARYDEIAERATDRARLELDGESAHYIVNEKLRPLGLVASEDGATPKLNKIDPLLALKYRFGVVSERVVNLIATILRPAFTPVAVAAVLGALAAVDVWLFGFHGIAQSLRQTLYDPAFILLMLGLVIVSAAFHECGHAAACKYGGARPGKMGVGLYLVWPAFYTDVTDAYRLGRAGRLRTDLGGVYFNAIFIVLTAVAYFLTGFEPLLLMIPIQHAQILHQFLPVVRLDGYYIVSDLAGVPDMFMRIGPTMKSLLPWSRSDRSVSELKPWVRVVVTAYVLTVVPLLLFVLTVTVVNLPRVLATSGDSVMLQLRDVEHAIGDGAVLAAVVGCIQLLVLVLIPAGLLLMLLQLGRSVARRTWAATEHRPLARGVVVVLAAGAAAFAGLMLLPAAVYRPIQPSEKGTLAGALKQLGAIPSGHPALTREHARRLGGSPSESQSRPNLRKRPVTARPDRSGRSVGTRHAPAAPGASPRQPAAPRPPSSPASTEPPSPGRGAPTAPSATLSTPSRTLPTPVVTVTTPPATVTTPTLPASTLPTPTLPGPTLPTLP